MKARPNPAGALQRQPTLLHDTHRRPRRGPGPALALCLPLALMAWAGPTAWAQTAPATPPAATTPAAGAKSPKPAMAEAEVRRVDAASGRIQLRHGYIANLDMPPMTMVFRVASPGLLEGLQEGDRILFTAERIDGAYTVTSVQKRP